MKVHHDFGEAWDASDVAALLRFRKQGKTYQWIADRMGRTVAGVRSKLYRLSR